MATVNLKSAAERVSAGQEAGDSYISALESIRDTLTDDGNGASLGTMVGAQLEMTEVETRYMVESGIPKKASGANQAAAQEVKKAAG
mgnify:CR=1 FL=1